MAQAVVLANQFNKTSNFFPSDDNWKLTELPIVASVAFEQGTAVMPEIVSNTTTGNYKKMGTANALGGNFAGIIAETVASTDADYATAGKRKMVWVPVTPLAEAYFTVGAGTFTAVDVGKTCAFHSDSKSLAVDTDGLGAVITGYISSTRGTCDFSVPKAVTA